MVIVKSFDLLIKSPPVGEEEYLLELLTQHVPAGVDEAAYVKAGFLAAITRGEDSSPLIDKVKAVIVREEKRLAEIEAGVTTRPGLDEMLRQKGLK